MNLPSNRYRDAHFTIKTTPGVKRYETGRNQIRDHAHRPCDAEGFSRLGIGLRSHSRLSIKLVKHTGSGNQPSNRNA
jgi:hypothetical protein